MRSHGDGLSTADYTRLSRLIYAECGINLGSERRTMLEIRLKRRFRSLGLSSCSQYCDLLFAPGGRENEIVHLIDVVTTNKTDFFREPAHFDYLASKALPELLARFGAGRKYLAWSAGCSSGEEPYTLAMVLSEYAEAHPGFRFSVLATDISTAVLAKAALGIYKTEIADSVPAALRRKYFMRSRDPDSNLLRIAPELRALVDFRRLNFMDADLGLSEFFEVIFCRNVVIYFDRPTQAVLFEKLARQLAPGGYLFVGHSETLHGMELPLAPAAPALYRRVNERTRL